MEPPFFPLDGLGALPLDLKSEGKIRSIAYRMDLELVRGLDFNRLLLLNMIWTEINFSYDVYCRR